MSKALFLHLSDIHLVDNSPIDDISRLIVDSVMSHNTKDVDKIFVLFTGDMTASAEESQFNKFDAFLKKVVNKVENKLHIKPITLIVPGNHDIFIKDRKDCPEELLTATTIEKEVLLTNEIPRMKNALNQCNNFDCFITNPFVDIKEFDCETIKYRFILINSSSFSSLNKNDKEHHFLRKKDLEFPKNYLFGKKTVTLVLEHHRPDWFDEDTVGLLDTYIDEEVSIAFFGHEHNPKYEIREGKTGLVIYDKGGELVSNEQKNNAINGSFSFSLLDEKTNIVERFICNLNYKTQTFVKNEPDKTKIRTHEILPLKESFVKEFFAGPLQNTECSLLDIFVMPSITNSNGGFDLSSIATVIKKLKETKEIIIEGSTKIGKTALLKAVFSECQKTTPCIFLSIKSSTNDNARKLVKDAFEEMYGDERDDFNIFQSKPFDSKIIFIDNFELLKDVETKEKVLNYLRQNFGNLIISYRKSSIPQESIKELGLFDEKNVYHSYGITKKGRKEITSKICKIKNVDESNVEAVFDLYEREINGVSIFDFTDPLQGIYLIETIIDQKLYEERNTNKAFTETFAYQLRYLLVTAGREQDLDSYLTVLSSLAFKIWKNNKEAVFSESDLLNVYTTCKDEERCLIDFKTLNEVLTNSTIVYEYSKDTYRFKRNSFLAYFISQEIIRLNQFGETEHLNKLITDISYGINSDILLFILFYTRDVKVIKQLSNNLNHKYEKVKKLDFSDNKNILFSEQTSLLEESDDNKVSKSEQVVRADKKEKELVVQGEEREIRQISIKQEDDIKKEMFETLKTVEIVSKAVSGFQSIFTIEARKELFKSVYDAIMRMISFIFDFKNENIEELEKEYTEYKEKRLIELAEEKEKNKKEIELLKSSSVKNFLYGLLIQALTMYESSLAFLIASKQTMTIINSLSSNQFENCVFKLYSYIYTHKFDKFISELNFAKNNFHPNKINNLVKFFVRIYIIHNSFSQEQLNLICSVSNIKKTELLPYISREEKLL